MDAALADHAARPPGHLGAAHQPRAHADEGEGEDEADQDQEEALLARARRSGRSRSREKIEALVIMRRRRRRRGRAAGSGPARSPSFSAIRSRVSRTAATAKTGVKSEVGDRLRRARWRGTSRRGGRGRGARRARRPSRRRARSGPGPRRRARSCRGRGASCGRRAPRDGPPLDLHHRPGQAEADEGERRRERRRASSPTTTISDVDEVDRDQPAGSRARRAISRSDGGRSCVGVGEGDRDGAAVEDLADQAGRGQRRSPQRRARRS